jgi:hypothetical protein
MSNSYHTEINGPGNYCAVRWNGNSRCFEAMDQWGTWNMLMINTRDMGVTLPSDAYDLLTWAREERERQRAMRALREKYPTLDQALTHVEVITALVTERG